jgi:phosphoribosylglycinamide formyltransferase 2
MPRESGAEEARAALLNSFGPPGSSAAVTVMLLGAGELGKEVAIELQRLGIEVVACDRYPAAPAMQVAHRSHVLDMSDPAALRDVVLSERPDLILPEIEAIATEELLTLEQEGFRVAPTARAARLTMDREGIRRLAAETLGSPTSPYRFADDRAEFLAAVAEIGTPCVVKPVMSSSGKGQSVVRTPDEAAAAYELAATAGRVGGSRVIVEGLVAFDYEITLLTVRHRDGTSFCDPIGHVQIDGDYRESWQPASMAPATLARAQQIAETVTGDLGGYGIFGVELFIRGEDVLFSEVSPRPHDTGLVTIASQDLSEFALHARAVLGLPIPTIRQLGPAASAAVVLSGDSDAPQLAGLPAALTTPNTRVLVFGKPEIHGSRRLAVALATGDSVAEARARAVESARQLTLTSSD